MTLKLDACALAFGMAAASVAFAQVKVDDPWIRATVPQQGATGAFMKLTAAVPLRLVAASSPAAGVVEVHAMSMEGGVMKMRAVAALDLAPGRTTELAPGGYHVMFLDLRKQVKAGDEVPLTLVFEDLNRRRSSVAVKVQARALGEPAAATASQPR
jgi:copper(I)-binding protein